MHLVRFLRFSSLLKVNIPRRPRDKSLLSTRVRPRDPRILFKFFSNSLTREIKRVVRGGIGGRARALRAFSPKSEAQNAPAAADDADYTISVVEIVGGRYRRPNRTRGFCVRSYHQQLHSHPE